MRTANLAPWSKLDTFRALGEHHQTLAAYCSPCERWAVLDLARLIARLPVV